MREAPRVAPVTARLALATLAALGALLLVASVLGQALT